jgi:Spy/CpxP family protein refolding chaperone
MSSERDRPGRVRVAAIAILLAVFVAGGLAGAAIDRTVHARWHEKMATEVRRGPDGPGGRRGRGPAIFAAGSPLAERLKLTPEQQQKIDSIIRVDRQKADSLYREVGPQLRARFDSTTAAIRAVLTPEQQAEFRRYREEQRARMKARPGERRGGRWDD